MTPELPLRALDGGALRRWAFRAREALGEYRQRLDHLNVFPVPDGDTGTNLTLSLRGALESLLREARPGGPTPLAGGTSGLGRTLLLNARGNSGVILGLLVRGLAEVFEESTEPPAGGLRRRGAAGLRTIDAATLARAMTRAAETAWQGVAEPVEGTILSVAQAAARAATAAADAGGDLARTVQAAEAAARAALERTPQQLASHAAAGVVDAGGAGLVVVLAALREVVTGEPVSLDLPTAAVAPPADSVASGGAYEVMYVLEGCAAEDAERLLRRLGDLGDSVVVAGDDELRTVHVHADDAGAVVEAALPLGQVHGIRISWLGDGAHLTAPASAPGQRSDDQSDEGAQEGVVPRLGLVVCADGAGLATALTDAGAVVVPDGPGRRATPHEIIEAARSTQAAHIAVFSTDGDGHLTAATAADLTNPHDPQLHVVPCRSAVQALAALSLADPESDPLPMLERLVAAARAVRTGIVRRTGAGGAAAGRGEADPVVGLVGDDVVHEGGAVVDAGVDVVETILSRGPGEIVVLVAGSHDEQAADVVRARLMDTHDDLEIELVLSGSAHHALLIGVE